MSKTAPERRSDPALEADFSALAVLLEKSYDVSIIATPDMVIKFVSSSITEVLGWQAHELIGQSGPSLVHPEDAPQVRLRHAAYVADPTLSGTMQTEIRLRHKRGHWVWFESRGINAMHLPPPFNGVIVHLHDISRRRRAEGRLERALSVANALIYEWDPSTDEVDRFGGGARFLGLPSDQLGVSVQDWAERVHPDDKARVLATLESARQAGTRLELEYRVRRGDESYCTVWERALTESGAGGDRRVLGLAIDISERRRVELELKESEARLRAVLDAEPQCVKVLDREGRLIDMNAAGLAMVDADEIGQLQGKGVEVLIEAGHQAAFKSLHQRALDGESGSLQFEILTLKGRRRWMESAAAPLRNAEGEISSVVAVTSDITERRRAEDWLRLQQQVLDTQAEGVVLANGAARIIYANRAFEQMFGYQPGGLDGTSWVRLTATPKAAAVRARNMRENQEPIRFEFDGIRSDASRFRAEVVLKPVPIAGTKHWVGVVQDVTEQRTLETMLIDATNRQQERLGYDLHDGLGQDLTAISLFLRDLQDRLQVENPALQGDVEEIRSMVSNAIDTTRAMAKGMSPLAVDEKGLVEALRTLAVRTRDAYDLTVRVRGDLGPGNEPGTFVAMQLYRIAQEALTNIARHAQARNVSLNLKVAGERIILRILDDGIGMPELEARPEGMGLRIMQYRVNMLGGELVIRRRPGGGTQVQVSCDIDRKGPGEARVGGREAIL